MAGERSTLVGDCKLWVRAIRTPAAAFVALLVLIAGFSDSHSRPLVWSLGILLLGASIWLGHVVRRERRTAEYAVSRARLVVAALVAAVSIVLMLLSFVDQWFEAFAFAGLGFFVIAVGAGISEARQYRRFEHVRGPLLLGASFFGMAAALILLPAPGALLAIGLFLVVALLGTELHTEDRLRSRPWFNPWLQALLGIGLVALAVGLMMSWGAGPVGGVIVGIVVIVLVLMAAVDSDSLLIVLVIAGALIWASGPRSSAIDGDHAAKAGEPYFLVLGDSYVSGEGAEKYYEGTNTAEIGTERTNTCRRAPTAWANTLALDPPGTVPPRVLFLACSGAVTENIRKVPRLDDAGEPRGAAELLEYKAQREKLGLTEPPRFVVLGVGGNDVGFGTIGKSCVGPGDCAELGHKFLDNLREVERKLVDAYRDVQEVVGAVPVVVVPYPIPVSDADRCEDDDVFLTANERKLVVSFVTELNAVVESAAATVGFHYMDRMESALSAPGIDLCRGPSSGLNFVDWNPQAGGLWATLTPTNWTHNSLHPNERGHEAMRSAARQWFVEHPELVALPAGAGTQHPVPEMGDLFDFGVTRLCGFDPDESCDIRGQGWLLGQTVGFIGTVFLPLILCAIGAWFAAFAPIRYASEHGITIVSLLARLPFLPGRRRRP